MYGRIAAGIKVRLQARHLGVMTLVSVAYFALALIALHLLTLSVDPISQTTSVYAVGPYGVVMSLAFLAMSVATVSLIAGLRRALPPSARSGVGLVLLGVWAVGVIVAMLFPIDVEGAQATLSGVIHRVNGPIAFLAFGIGALLVSRRFGRDESWDRIHDTALILSVAALAAFIAMLVSIAAEAPQTGLFQRIGLAAAIAWYGLLGSKLLGGRKPA